MSRATCEECKNDVPVVDSDQICCISCYDRLKKDVAELLRIKSKLEEFVDSHSRPEQKGIQDA